MTDRMLGAIEESLSGFQRNGIRWSAKTLTDRGAKSQESRFGADFLIVLSIDLPNFRISKGFLAQAKLIKDGRVRDLTELRSQCEKMLSISRDSYVFLYDNQGVRVAPATAVAASTSNPNKVYDKSAQRFFMDHLECFVGDPAIAMPSPDGLEALAKKFQTRTAQIIEAKPALKKEGDAGSYNPTR